MNRFLTLLLCLTPFLFSIEAQEWDCCCGGEYYLTVEGLYWRVNHDPIFIVNKSNRARDPTGARDLVYLYGDYDGGVRARIGYACDTFFTDLAYLNFGTLEKKSQSRGDFDDMEPLGGRSFQNGSLDFVKCLANFRYQNVDLRYGYMFCKTNCFAPFFYANARWMRVDFKYKLNGILEGFSEFNYSVDQKGKFQGGGLGFGIGSRYSFCRNFGVNTQLGFVALMGETVLNKYSAIDLQANTSPVYLVQPEVWRHIVPGIDFRLGIDYACCFSCFTLDLEIGYELNWYSNILDYTSVNNPPPDGTRRIPYFGAQEISFGGPFFRLTVGY